MTTAELIYQHAKRLPEIQAREVLNFIEFLEYKQPSVASTQMHPWIERLRRTPGVQWNGGKPSGGSDCPRIQSAKTVAERVLEDRV